MQSSGKLVIVGIVGIAAVAAGTSWWFRYNATRQAAKYWGSDVTRLIRDAPTVNLIRVEPTDDPSIAPKKFELFTGGMLKVTEFYDVSGARGMTHLRNAMLEDRNYAWPARQVDDPLDWRWMLGFRDESQGKRIFVLFTEDCTQTALVDSDHNVISCKPIAEGLSTMFAEFAAELPPVH